MFEGFIPVLFSFFIFVFVGCTRGTHWGRAPGRQGRSLKEGNDAHFIQDVGTLADEWVLHLVIGLLEVLLVFSD